MLVISNTTPIISLLKIGMPELLKILFGEIIIPQAVYNELVVNNSMAEEIERIKECSFLKVQKVENVFAVKLLQKQLNLGLGESEAIVLADSNKAGLLIIDEKKGRHIARDMGLPITGTLGILVEAKNHNYIDKLKPSLDKMMKTNIRISETLYNQIITSAGENYALLQGPPPPSPLQGGGI
jgi:uncharacterized protein